VVRPIVGGSRFLWRVVDAGIVDGMVNATGALSRAFGLVGSMVQTGAVNTYAFILTVGVVLILAAMVL
jgi:NADH-quinone oxidoreductase subunit L